MRDGFNHGHQTQQQTSPEEKSALSHGALIVHQMLYVHNL